jgi:hypothetical protein
MNRKTAFKSFLAQASNITKKSRAEILPVDKDESLGTIYSSTKWSMLCPYQEKNLSEVKNVRQYD